MWIFLNDGINKLKIPELTTFLRTKWQIMRVKHPLSRKKLVVGNQKLDTLSRHLNKAVEAGLITKQRNIYFINGEFRSAPNEYTPLDPTKKLWVENLSEIDDSFSYSLQKAFGKEHTAYYKSIYESTVRNELRIESVTTDDYEEYKIAISIEAPQLHVNRAIFYTKLH